MWVLKSNGSLLCLRYYNVSGRRPHMLGDVSIPPHLLSFWWFRVEWMHLHTCFMNAFVSVAVNGIPVGSLYCWQFSAAAYRKGKWSVPANDRHNGTGQAKSRIPQQHHRKPSSFVLPYFFERKMLIATHWEVQQLKFVFDKMWRKSINN